MEIQKMKARDAARMAIQSAVSVTAAYLIMKNLGLPEIFIALISAVLVIQSSVGDTLGSAWMRLLATAVGSAIGFLCVWLLPWGYGTAVALALTMLVINGIAGFKPDWRYGVVAAIAISLGSESNAIQTSLDRLIAIGVGVAVGILVTLLVWPDKAENRAVRFVRRALSSASEEFKVATDNLSRAENASTADISDTFHSNLEAARNSIHVAKLTETDPYRELTENLEKLYNAIVIVKRVGDRSEDSMGSDEEGLRQYSEKIEQQTTGLLKELAENRDLSDSDLEEYGQLIDRVQKDVELSDDKRSNTLRQSFVFGISEIKENLVELTHSFRKCNQR